MCIETTMKTTHGVRALVLLLREKERTQPSAGLADCCADAFSFLNILYIENEDVSKCLFFFRMYIGYKPAR